MKKFEIKKVSNLIWIIIHSTLLLWKNDWTLRLFNVAYRDSGSVEAFVSRHNTTASL